MKKAALALPLLAVAASGAEARLVPEGPRRAAPAPTDCSLSVGFGSYAVGIDRAAYGQIDRLLRADRAVSAVTSHPWGREGEVTLCARTRTRADAQRLFARIRAILPERPRGPITIQVSNGRRYVTPWRR